VWEHGRRNFSLRAEAGIFTYEVHPTRSFPGDRLPG